ncbi:MAG: CooT family nickel-binding protein [Fusicatenibacter sp.]|nr:CooT family nickel-binding protein [Lachnospiraceae bacterium]MDY2936793.1 CooT family nickel-binding protein [Fusicatenibacter sp.]
MCLATVYKEPDNTVVCRNVSRIDVDGEFVLIRDIMGEEIKVQGKIKMVDLANSIVELDCE